MSDELSDDQRARLLAFLERFGQLYGDGDFDAKAEWSTPALLALSLRAAEILGYSGQDLEQFFAKEFDVAGLGESEVINDMLVCAMMVDVESRVRAAAGGRN
jgi:hypothetical protein